jgi:predicted RNase H-like HicB family nuclease
MRAIKFYVYKESPHYVAQCLNVDVSSFGGTVEEAIQNLKEAVELHFEDQAEDDYRAVEEVLVGEGLVNA